MTSSLLIASDWTPRKQEAFRRMITIYARIARAIQLKHRAGRWFYFEPTAGSGDLLFGDDVIAGSPLIAAEAFNMAKLEVDCLFVECDEDRCVSLRTAVQRVAPTNEQVRWEVHCCDSREILNHPRPQRECGDYGLIYWDGLARDEYPAEQVAAWLRRNWAHDVLGMASATAPKRMGRERLDSLLTTATMSAGRRRYGYVSDTHHAWGWMFSLVTGWPVLAGRLSSPEMQLHDFVSVRGREILLELGTTKRERQLAFEA
jgi:hypothetical protein